MIVAALARNASDPAGADALNGALERDHDGSLLEDLGGFLGGGASSSIGGAILGHVFGGQRGSVESSLGRSTGLDGASIAKLLAMLAPIVMAALAKKRGQEGLDSGGLTDLLGGERDRMQEAVSRRVRRDHRDARRQPGRFDRRRRGPPRRRPAGQPLRQALTGR